MLTLTDNALTIAATAIAQQATAPDAGLRISAAGTEAEPRFAVTLVPAPEPGDQVIGDDDLHVFVEDVAVDALSEKTLDAQVDEEGTVSFLLLPRAA